MQRNEKPFKMRITMDIKGITRNEFQKKLIVDLMNATKDTIEANYKRTKVFMDVKYE